MTDNPFKIIPLTFSGNSRRACEDIRIWVDSYNLKKANSTTTNPAPTKEQRNMLIHPSAQQMLKAITKAKKMLNPADGNPMLLEDEPFLQ